jgi:hypothetical protein
MARYTNPLKRQVQKLGFLREPPELKYYEYISTAKLEMLLPQAPPSVLDRLNGELTVNAGPFSASVKKNDGQAPSEDMHHSMRDRVRMLDLLIKYAKETDQIGEVDQIDDIDNLKPFLHGVLQMRWMHLTDAHGLGMHRLGSGPDAYKRRMMHLLEEPGIIFWAGYHPREKTNRARTVVGLGGSIKHVIGAKEVNGRTETGASSLLSMGSFIDPILWHLAASLREVPLINPSARPAPPLDSNNYRVTPSSSNECRLEPANERSLILSTMAITASGMFSFDDYGPTSWRDFVAIPLAAEKERRQRMVLATPLYVARASTPPRLS